MKLIRNAKVEFDVTENENGRKSVIIGLPNGVEHTFDYRSRVVKHLELLNEDQLEARFQGGTYLVDDENLIDYRSSDYKGFVHTDEMIEKMVEKIGTMNRKLKKVPEFHRSVVSTQAGRNIVLGNLYQKNELNLSQLGLGGQFTTSIFYLWSPFARFVSSAVMLERLICENGMVGVSNFFNANIPLINRWEENMEIAQRQIDLKIKSTVGDRLQKMVDERASVSLASNIAKAALLRLRDSEILSEKQHEMLVRMSLIANPEYHVSQSYAKSVFERQNVAAQVPSHLTAFDAFNMITEIRTHTPQTASSTAFSLDMMANRLVMEPSKFEMTASIVPVSEFSNPEQAFFSTIRV